MSLVTSLSRAPKGAGREGGGGEVGRGWVEAGQNRVLMSEAQAGTQLENHSLFLKIKCLNIKFPQCPEVPKMSGKKALK